MTNCFAEHFYTFINNEEINENIEKRLLDYGVTIGTVIEMYRDNQSLSGIQDKVYQYYEHYTTQRMKVIDELFALYGLPKITENAQGKSQDEALLKDVEKLVDRRNAIVHKGDYKKNEIKSISVKDAENIKKIELLVKNIEEIVENRFKRFETAEK